MVVGARAYMDFYNNSYISLNNNSNHTFKKKIIMKYKTTYKTCKKCGFKDPIGIKINGVNLSLSVKKKHRSKTEEKENNETNQG